MPYCADGCYFDIDANGRLSIGPTCNVECLLQCFETVDVPPSSDHYVRPRPPETDSGHYVRPGSDVMWDDDDDDCLGQHFGSPQQWPKRFDTHYVLDNENQGYHSNGGDPLSDDPTFIASSQGRVWVAEDHPTPIISPPSALSQNDPSVTKYAGTSVQFLNDYGCPVMVMVEASNWYHDLANLPLSSSGGARWIGEARVRVRDTVNSPWVDMEWQRAFETIVLRLPNANFNDDIMNIRGHMTGPNSLGEAMEAMFNRIKICMGTTASELSRQFGTYKVVHDIPGQPGTDVAAPIGATGYSFPFNPADLSPQQCGAASGGSYSDYNSTYGNSRPGGRRHKGQDIIAPEGVDALAVIDGEIALSGYANASCGYRIRLNGSDGVQYTYCHLQSTGLIAQGSQVVAGQKVGQNGHTGNAVPSCPHIHFEMHGGNVDPHPFLMDVWNQISGVPGGSSSTDPETGGTITETIQNTDLQNRAVEAIAQIDLLDPSIVQPELSQVADRIVFNDFQQEDNTAYMDRLTKTGGSWQMPILLRPGQGIYAETRSRFGRWSFIPLVPYDTGTFFNTAGGSARSGKITMTVYPIFGSSRCDDERLGDPWWGSLGISGSISGGIEGN